MKNRYAIYTLLIIFCLQCGSNALIEITKPGDGALVNGLVEIIASTTGSNNADSIEYYIDGELAASLLALSDTFIWDASSFLHGSVHHISAVAFFANGLIAESDIVSVTIYSHRTVLAEVFGEYF